VYGVLSAGRTNQAGIEDLPAHHQAVGGQVVYAVNRDLIKKTTILLRFFPIKGALIFLMLF
jgi:hypothetical protein